MQPRALIFDFDGTLAELNIDFAAMRAEVEVLARALGLGGPWPGEGYLLEQVAEVAARLGNGFAQRAGQLIMDRELAAARQGRLFAFTRQLLEQARAQGLGLAIISRNCGPAIRMVFPQIDYSCDVFLPRETVTHTKPHPGHPLAALERLGLTPAQAVLIGDHPTDVQTALAAGCLPVGVASGRVNQDDLRAAGAVLVLPDASGLLGALSGLPAASAALSWSTS
jgi:phosphoglycolate phosphatase